ncbi:Uncharacterised protein [Mycobacteroides abscessus subsp. massiliense]|nr:Uncharacterised protein [Mycobacteroides abscessus subsp. massiliense]
MRSGLSGDGVTTPYQLRRISLITLSLIFWVIETSLVVRGRWFSYDSFLTIFVAISLLGKYYLFSRAVYKAPTNRSGPSPEINDAMTFGCTQRIYDSVDKDALTLFGELLGNPSRLTRRIGKTIEITSRSHIVRTAYLIDVPARFADKIVAIPITLVSRRRLLDSFQAHDSERRVSPLSQEEVVGYILATIRLFIANKKARRDYLSKAKINGKTLEREVFDLICDNNCDAKELRRDLIEIDGLATNAAELIYKLLTDLGGNLPIVVLAKVPTIDYADHPGGTIPVRITTEQRRIPQLAVPRAKLGRVRDGIRLAMGVRPTILTSDLSESTRCVSYHLELFGPEGTYLARQNVIDIDEPKNTTPMSSIMHRFLPRFGQRYSHLYLNRRSPYDKKHLLYVAHYYERLPGSIVPAALTAVGAAILIITAAIMKLKAASGGDTDVVAVMLALPAIAGGWVGFEPTSGLFGGTLNAKLSRLATMILSLSAATLFITTASLVDKPDIWITRSWAKLWILLSSLAVLNAILTTLSWAIRSNVQTYFLSRSNTEGEMLRTVE